MRAGGLLLLLATTIPVVRAQDGAPLRITKDQHEFVVQTPNGALVIRRAKSTSGVDKGFVQPLIPVPGVTLVTEVEVLQALNDPDTMVIDMRDEDTPLKSTIPNSYHIPYNELEDHMDALGCRQLSNKQWDCANAAKIVGFCYGPMCVQSPTGIKNMVKLGYPVSKISYYRGGMLDWEGIGLTTATGNRPMPAAR